VLYPLLRIRQLAGDVPVAIFPSDHYVSDDGAFVTAVRHAVAVARERPESVVLLGIEATAPETEYGWIDPIRFYSHCPASRRSRSVASGKSRHCVWPSDSSSAARSGTASSWSAGWRPSSGSRAAWPPTFSPPSTAGARDRQPTGNGGRKRAYAALESSGFSERVLVPGADGLLTVRAKSVEWSDWGHPQRVMATMRRTGWRPAWLNRVELASAG